MALFNKIALVATLGLALTFTIGCGEHSFDEMLSLLEGSSSSGGKGNGGVSSPSSSSSSSSFIGANCTLTDNRDGKVYKCVEIGGQVWMAENLKYNASGSKCYGEGGMSYWNPMTNETTTFSNSDAQTFCNVCGKLYDDRATEIEVCPQGWHTSTVQDWVNLVRFVDNVNDGDSDILTYNNGGEYLKSSGGWAANGQDTYGFTAIPCGTIEGGCLECLDPPFNHGKWWIVTGAFTAYVAMFSSDLVVKLNLETSSGTLRSIRCVKDS